MRIHGSDQGTTSFDTDEDGIYRLLGIVFGEIQGLDYQVYFSRNQVCVTSSVHLPLTCTSFFTLFIFQAANLLGIQCILAKGPGAMLKTRPLCKSSSSPPWTARTERHSE